MTSPPLEVKNFVLWLSTHNPQLFYKPLFSLSAATQPATLASNLHLVTLQSQLVGASRFWTHADPQMLIIVLMGDISPKQGKGKTNEGELSLANVKIGRYAVLLELIKAFDDIDDEDARTGSRLRGFVEAIESGLSAMLAAEVRIATSCADGSGKSGSAVKLISRPHLSAVPQDACFDTSSSTVSSTSHFRCELMREERRG